MFRSVTGCALVALFACLGCSGGSSSSSGATGSSAATGNAASGNSGTPAPAGNSGNTAAGNSGNASQPPASTVDFAALAAAMETRRQQYLQGAVSGSISGSEGYYTQIARLDLNTGPVDVAPLDDLMDFMDLRKDTADFKATALLRLMLKHGQHALLPVATRDRARTTLLNFKWWIDEPGTDEMVYWSENHYIMFTAGGYLAGQLYPQDVFANSGLTGSQMQAKFLPKILRWLDERMRFGLNEWNSPVYYPHTLAPLLNLVDFAADAAVREQAAMVLDLMVFDLARLTQNGSFGATAGRIYEEHKWSGRSQSLGDFIEILFGTRGYWRGRSSTSATSFATSTYQVPHALLGLGVHAPDHSVDRSRVSLSFSEAAANGVGMQTLEDGLAWWTRGAYLAPDLIVLTRDMCNAWDLWHYPYFQPLQLLSWVPDSQLASLSNTLSPLSEGSVLSTAKTYTFRNPHAMLSSVQRYRKGQVGYQQHAWQATLDMDAMVFTTQPGMVGRQGPGEWTGSGSLPHVIQQEDVAVILYNPPTALRATIPPLTHAWFPQTGYDEVQQQGSWTFGRKGEGYVGLYSALPTRWQSQGNFADIELIADGYRNVWLCQVGCQSEDGSFADFMAALTQATVTAVGAGSAGFGQTLSVSYDAPGLGVLEVDWSAAATLNGQTIDLGNYPRFENPWATQPFGSSQLSVDYEGANLTHDLSSKTRSGDGL